MLQLIFKDIHALLSNMHVLRVCLCVCTSACMYRFS